jgi:hypothetical protein
MMRGSGRQARQAGLHLRTARARTAQARCKRRRRTRERSVSGCRGAAHWQPIPRTPGGASARTLRGDAARSICAACARRVPCPDKHWGQQRKGRARASCGRRKHVSSTSSRLAQHENVRGVLHVVDGAVSRVGAARRPSAEVAVAHHGQALREDSGDPLGRPRPSARWASTPKLPAALHVSSCVFCDPAAWTL